MMAGRRGVAAPTLIAGALLLVASQFLQRPSGTEYHPSRADVGSLQHAGSSSGSNPQHSGSSRSGSGGGSAGAGLAQKGGSGDLLPARSQFLLQGEGSQEGSSEQCQGPTEMLPDNAQQKEVALEESPQQVEGPREDTASCPVPYEHLSLGEVEARLADERSGGRLTPLFGNHSHRGGCRHCTQTQGWANFCQFKSHGPVCPDYVQRGIISSWLRRGYAQPLTLTPCDLWRHLEGRTLLLIGDSMMLDFFKASFCFMMEFWTSLGPGEWDLQTNFTEDRELRERLTPDGVAPTCVPLLGGATRICYVRTDKAQTIVDSSLPLLLEHKLVSPSDLLVVNFGLHHGDPEEYKSLLARFARYVKDHQEGLPRVIWQQTSAQHFLSEGGEYPGGKPPFKCGPIQGYSVEGDGEVVLDGQRQGDPSNTLQGQWRNAAADAAMRAAGIPVIGSFNESLTMWQAHRDNGRGYECTHYCHPSAPQMWVASLYRTLEENKVGPAKIGAGAAAAES